MTFLPVKMGVARSCAMPIVFRFSEKLAASAFMQDALAAEGCLSNRGICVSLRWVSLSPSRLASSLGQFL